MSYRSRKSLSKDLVIRAKAAEHEHQFADPFGVRCRNYRQLRGRLLYLMLESGSALLQHEAEHMRRCGLLIGVIDTQVGSFVERDACNCSACVCCGNRSGRSSRIYVESGIEFHRSIGNVVFLATLSFPPMVGTDAAKYLGMAWSVQRKFVQMLADCFDPDWYVKFEATEAPDGLRFHAHFLLATPVNCPAPRKKAARRVALSALEAFFPSGQRLTTRRVFKAIRDAGVAAIAKVFPNAREMLSIESVRRKAVDVRKLRGDAQTPGRVASYITKAMPCGMTPEQLSSVSMATLEKLISAVKPPGARRARKMSQSKAGSWFSRRSSTPPGTRPRRKIPTPKAKAEIRHDELLKLVDDFLSNRPQSAPIVQWLENVGDVLAQALTNDGDSRGLSLLFKLMAVRRVQRRLKRPIGYQGPLASFVPPGSSSATMPDRSP